MLIEEAKAGGATSAEKQSFWTAIDAFNNMWTIYNPTGVMQPDSKLYQVLHPDVIIFNVTDDGQRASGLRDAVDKLYALAGANFDPRHNPGPPYKYGPPNFTQAHKVSGIALWTDCDHAGSETIPYTFHFQNNLIVRMRAKIE
ncbi:MAG TPA: hypothetical protein VKU03_08005 [Roseiarcus sp.]|nr:hypothetical protein [Roseiarcus sp.]